MVGDLKNSGLKKALNTADMTPENVASLLFSQKPSDVRMLYAGLSPAVAPRLRRRSSSARLKCRAAWKTSAPTVSRPRSAASANRGRVLPGRRPCARRRAGARPQGNPAGIAGRAFPPTGVQAAPYAMGAGFTALLRHSERDWPLLGRRGCSRGPMSPRRSGTSCSSSANRRPEAVRKAFCWNAPERPLPPPRKSTGRLRAC
jgi:hypothetical protein